jgi:hypothetical protein
MVFSGFSCDSCRSILDNVRVMCMDCSGSDSVDLCEDPACVTTTIGPDKRADLEKPHLPDHDVFKVYTTLQMRYQGTREQRAKEVLKAARGLLGKEATETEPGTSNEKPEPTCSSCKKKIFLSPPCWMCMVCGRHLKSSFCLFYHSHVTNILTAELFICDDCDLNGLAFNETHDQTHAIVRCKPAAKDVTTEQRLVALEDRVVAMDERMVAMDERMVGIDGRLTRMEKMLHDALQGKVVDVLP